MITRRMGRFRGHEIEMRDGVAIFVDTGLPTVETWKARPCGHCGRHNTPEGHDACLGTIPGAVNACCGHGNTAEAYIQFSDGTAIRGEMVRQYLHSGSDSH